MSAVGDARKRLAGMQSDAPCVLVTHADPEEYARIYNEGYDAAMAQHLADDPSAADDWLADKIAEALRNAADVVQDDCRHSRVTCFCGSANWLRDRADQIAAVRDA